jgi:hypothetical protein
MQDVSAQGFTLVLRASQTFPNGFTITEVADDADPFDIPAVEIASTAMNVNGDLVTWSSPTPMTPTINVIPGSESDKNLSILWDANRAARGKRNARDVITLVASYPDGSTKTFSEGKMTSGMPGGSVASGGRIKTNAYVFAFQDFSQTRA